MGFGLTLKLFLSHLFSEPATALQGIGHSIKDIVEILFFYFTEISLTACYVILFILAARFLLRRAPKIYSYALWGVVYFKLVSVFRLEFFTRSLIPQPQIDKIYYNIAPDYTAFYSTEAGIVSQVNSEFVAPVPVVTPIYIPALIWFIVLCVILTLSAVMYLTAYSKLKNSSLNNLKDNVYISDAISTPFVFGIVRPKIYLPKGLTEQQQNYVITHEKVHIRRGDHIIKLFAFVITCTHWFNPLVWLSFFLLEKDMEMSCDEKVLQILGHEHKKDYSYCILSLASDKRFVPKAYLSFGDSDTKKRIKNVLNYKKPAVIASVMTIIGIVVIAVGMLADSGVVYIPGVEPSSNENGIVENNFPNGFDSFFFTFNGYSTSVGIHMPEGWSFENRNIQTDEYPEYLTLDDDFGNCFDIYNNNGEKVGAMGVVSYTEYMGAENELMAIYGAVALPNMYNFDLNEHYVVADSDENGNWEKATTKVYHSPQLNRDLGKAEVTTYGDVILAYNRECLVFVAIEFKEDYFSDGELKYIAQSLSIKPENSSFGTASALLNMHYRNMETGSKFDISEYASEEVLALLNAKTEIAKHRMQIFGIDKQSYRVQVIPYETEKSWIEDENSAVMKMQVVRTFRYNTANFDSSQSEVVSLRLDRNEKGNFIITDYRLDGKDLTFNDMDADYWKAVANGNGAEFLAGFVDEYKNFISNIDSSANVEIDWTFAFPASKLEISRFVTDNDYVDVLYSVARQYGYSAAQIKTLYENLFWDYINSEFRLNGNDEHVKEVFDRIILGQTQQEVTLWVREQLIAQGFSEETLKTLARRSWSPIELYYMTDETAQEFVSKLLDPDADSDYVVNRWDLSTSCAKESTEDAYVITYCDEKISCSTGLLSFDNTNDFDITVHLLSTGNGELKVDIPAGSTAALSVDSVKTEYTIGIHADVAADTDITLIVREVKTE